MNANQYSIRPNQLFAGELQGSISFLLAAAQESIDELEKEIFEEIAVFLVDAGRDQQLPGSFVAVLDRVQQVRLARPLVTQDRHHFRMRARVVAVEIDDAEKLVALGGE